MIGPTNRWGLDVGAHLFQVRQMTHLLVVSDKRSTNGQIPSVAATVSGLFQCWPSGHPSFNLGIFRPSLSQAYIRSRCSWPQVAPRFDRKVRNFRSFPCGDRRLTFDMKAGKARLGSADHSFGSTGPELSTGATIRCTNHWAEVTSALRMSASSRRAVKVLQTHDRGPRLEVVLSVRDEGGHHTASFIKRPASGR